jgi:hypothetical protein
MMRIELINLRERRLYFGLHQGAFGRRAFCIGKWGILWNGR